MPTPSPIYAVPLFQGSCLDVLRRLDPCSIDCVITDPPSSIDGLGTGGHICVKPLRLMEHLIKVFTKEGDIVLDPFAGSGTTGLAALNTGRHTMLIESEPDYCDIIAQRCGVAVQGGDREVGQ